MVHSYRLPECNYSMAGEKEAEDMSEMIERVAAAIHEQAFDPMEWDEALEYARTMIVVMREPTDAMKLSISGNIGLYGDGFSGLNAMDIALGLWHEAIDEALAG